METIPLRSYNREIEQLIDSNHSKDALNHCQQILNIYPRCLETYRLMGKAYLELQLYELAEDSFQKVLSSIPDDFTANLGMSLLQEKQNNLGGTIWHMERAYESQPSNTAVQSELRRLYQQRDGIDTSRIRLTRGALVRMYIKGDLIPQAINEIQAILQEDASRIDIRILHSIALLKAEKKDEALQNCRLILQELPYSYEANRILFENSPASTSIEEAQNYQLRLRELDPYYEFTNTVNPDPQKVPEEEVKISIPDDFNLRVSVKTDETRFVANSLEHEPPLTSDNTVVSSDPDNKQFEFGQKIAPEEERPAWMEGIEIASFGQDNKSVQSDYFSGSSSTLKKEFESSEPMTTEDPTPINNLPVPNDPYEDQTPDANPPSNPFLTSTGSQIPVAEPGDIPEWLRALASEPPAASSDAITAPLRVPGETGVLQTGEENLDFLGNLPGGPQSSSPNTQDLPERRLNLAAESLPGILPADPFLVTSETTQPIPLDGEGGTGISSPKPNLDMPDWLRNAAESNGETSVSQDLGPKSEPIIPPEPKNEASFSVEDFSLPAEVQEPIQPESQPENGVPTPEIEQYLEQLRKDISPGEQPDWLQKENLGNDIEALFDKDNKPSDTPVASEQSSDWMADLKKEEVGVPEVPVITPTISVPNVPDWLFTPETNDEDTAPIQMEGPVTQQPTPEWMKDLKPDIADISSFNQPKTDESKDKDEDFSFLDSKSFDFQQPDIESLIGDTESSTNPLPNNELPEDLAALLREETEKDVHTYPLPDDEPVPQTFTPSDFFSNEDFQLEQEPEMELPGSSGLEEESSNILMPNIESDSEPETIEKEQFFVEERAFLKETGPVIPIEEIQPLESVENSQEFEPSEQTIPVVEPPPFVEAETPPIITEAEKPFTAETFEEEPIRQEIPADIPVFQLFKEEQPITKEITEEIPATQFIQVEKEESHPALDAQPAPEVFHEEKPVVNIIPEMPPTPQLVQIEKPVFIPISEVQPAPQPILDEKLVVKTVPDVKPASKIVQVEKPGKKEKLVTPPPTKVIRAAEPRKITRKATRSNVEPVQKPGVVSADLSRARESIAQGDLLAGLRRYIKLVNSNKSLDHVSSDLKDLVKKNPKNYLAWQTFGDARLRSNKIQEALDAYAKAADLLK